MAVWQKAFKLLLKVYEVTKTYPAEEKYSLVSDLPAVVSAGWYVQASKLGYEQYI